MTALAALLTEHIRETRSSWSMGSYGAVAEFFQEPDEAIDAGDFDVLSRVTPRGGIRIELQQEIGICAFNNTSSHGDRSRQHIALCLPKDLSRMTANDTLTDLGPDVSALNEIDRSAILFDLGVSAIGTGCHQMDFCIRISDPDLVHFCRDHCGSGIFEHGSPVFPRLLESQPHRVVITRLGRIEVYQEIGGEHTDSKTPEGPHTHLLPELLSLNLTHSTDTPIKDGWVPCAFLYPDSAVFDGPGEAHR